MFIYNLYADKRDSIQLSGDAVVALFPFLEPDTFNFKAQNSNPMGITKGEIGEVIDMPSGDVMKMGGPILLDNLIMSLSVQSSKSAHQDGMHLSLKDPNNNLLSLINPGDWIVCWMFDNPKQAAELRTNLLSGSLDGLNGFHSGLKFLGKCLAPRIQHISSPNGAFIKTCSLQATAFSELDAQMYYDPFFSIQRLSEFEFITSITSLLNDKFVGIPNKVHEIVGLLLASCLGCPPRSGGQATPNSPMKVPSVIGRILGLPNARNYMDILTAVFGIQKYGDNYNPVLRTFSAGGTSIALTLPNTQQANLGSLAPVSNPSTFNPGTLTLDTNQTEETKRFSSGFIHYGLKETGKPLTGVVFAQIVPFNNVPLWSILEQHIIPVANEMYSTLRYSDEQGIVPHLIVRQIPFNTEDFVSKSPPDYTAFKELPRWEVQPEMVLTYETGKSNSMRVNYVHVQVSSGLPNDSEIQQFVRASTSPRWDGVDIARNGLKAMITQTNGVYSLSGEAQGQRWTDMAADRLIGSHLKLSGSIAITGVQEPICAGDNLQYDGFVYHIESIEHRLQVNPDSGHKSFSTHLAISNGVPTSGVALPEIAIRQFETNWGDVDTMRTPEGSLMGQTFKTRWASSAFSDVTTVKHTVVPASNVEEG